MATTFDDKLPAFQKYLLEKNLAPAKNVPFYAHWVSRFLDYARRNEFSAQRLRHTGGNNKGNQEGRQRRIEAYDLLQLTQVLQGEIRWISARMRYEP